MDYLLLTSFNVLSGEVGDMVVRISQIDSISEYRNNDGTVLGSWVHKVGGGTYTVREKPSMVYDRIKAEQNKTEG